MCIYMGCHIYKYTCVYTNTYALGFLEKDKRNCFSVVISKEEVVEPVVEMRFVPHTG